MGTGEREFVPGSRGEWLFLEETIPGILPKILTYVVEGKHNTALLSNEDNRNTAFDYLLGTLQ